MRHLIDKVRVSVIDDSERVTVQITWADGHRSDGETVRPVGRLDQLSYFLNSPPAHGNWPPLDRPPRHPQASTTSSTSGTHSARNSVGLSPYASRKERLKTTDPLKPQRAAMALTWRARRPGSARSLRHCSRRRRRIRARTLALVVKELMESAHRYVVVGGDCRRIQLRVAEVVLDEGVDPLHQRLRPDFGRKLVLGVQVLSQAGRREVDGDRAETT